MQVYKRFLQKSFIHPCYFGIKKVCIIIFYVLYCIQWGDKKSTQEILQLDLNTLEVKGRKYNYNKRKEITDEKLRCYRKFYQP